jgi:hypothetical protein
VGTMTGPDAFVLARIGNNGGTAKIRRDSPASLFRLPLDPMFAL